MIKEPLAKELLKESRKLSVKEYTRGDDKNYTVIFETGVSALFDEEEFYKYDLYNTEDPLRFTLGELAFEINQRRCFLLGVSLLLCSLKPSGQIAQNMRQAGFCDDDIEFALEKLNEEEYIDDKRFAVKYVQKKLSGGKTAIKMIRSELVAKGVPEDIADDALRDFETDDLETALKLVEKKRRNGDGDNKIMRFLASKGFDTSVIFKAVKG